MHWRPEAGGEPVFVTSVQLREWLLTGHFDHALHIVLIGLVLLRGFLVWK